LAIVIWITSISSQFYAQGEILFPAWARDLILAGLAITMTVNALATGLIVFRIFMVFRQSGVTSDDHGTKLRSIIFVIIESGLLLFSIQLARLVVTILTVDAGYDVDVYDLIVPIHQQLNVIR